MEAYRLGGSTTALTTVSGYVRAECEMADEDEDDNDDDIVYDFLNLNDTGYIIPDWLRTLINHEYIHRINGSLCIYIAAANGWMPLRSTAALRFIADITGGASASVNYSVAAEPALVLIKWHVWPTTTIDVRQFSVRYEYLL
jgi:hypothetical protein